MVMDDMQKIRLRDLVAFHRIAYAPGNLVLAVVGNMPAATARALAEKHFGGLATQPPMAHTWTGRDVKPVALPKARPGLQVLAMGYPRSPLDSPDDAVLDVIAHLLTVGPDAYLKKQLIDTRKAAAISGAISYPASTGGGLLSIISAPVPGGTLEDLKKVVQSAIDDLANQPLPEAALLPAKRRFIASAVRLLEEDLSAADVLARTVASLGSAQTFADLIKQLDAITSADVQRVAKKYLRPDAAVSVTWVGPRQ